MKRICLLLIRLYPAAWRNRYGVEFEEMLHAWEGAGKKDAADILLHCMSVWVWTVCASGQRAATATAVVFFTLGAVCACMATQGGEELWRSAGAFCMLCILQIPVAGIVGITTARRSGGPALGISLLNVSLLLPAVALYVVSHAMAAGAEAFPVQKYTPLDAHPSAELAAAMWRDALGSRESLLHWGKASVLAGSLTIAPAWLFGLSCVWLTRKRRPGRVMGV